MHRPSCLALLAGLLPAQNHFVPAEHWFVRLECRDLPAIIQACEQSPLGALLGDAEMQATLDALRASFAADSASYRRLADCAERLSLLTADELLQRAFFALDPADFRSLMLSSYRDQANGGGWSMSLASFEPQPRAEGRLTLAQRQLAQKLADCLDSRRDGDQKVGGFPADVFAPRESMEDRTYLPEFYGRFAMLHLPGQFVFGSGILEQTGSFGQRPDPDGAPAGLAMTLRFDKLPGIAPPLPGLGLRQDAAMTWSLRFVDRLLQGEIAFGVDRDGLLGALLAAKAPLPRQPLPADALLQLRLSVDPGQAVEKFLALARSLAGTIPTDDKALQQVTAAATGGIAIGVAAPAPGGLIPRLWLSLGIRDPQAFAAVLQLLPQGDGGVRLEPRQLAGVDCTVVRLPDLPPALQPCFCVQDGVLHAAESTQSLTTLLRLLQQGAATAMDVGDAPLPAGRGTELAFDLRYDFAAIYRTLHEVWLQPLRLLVKAEAGSMFSPTQFLLPLVDPDILPPPETIAEHVAPGRAVLRLDGDTLRYQEASALGGPVLAPILGAYSLMIGRGLMSMTGYRLQALVQRIERHHLELLAAALQKHEKITGRKAQGLADLAAAGLLDDDALLMPDDEAPLAVAYTDAQGQQRTLKTSFLFVPAGFKVHLASREAAEVTVVAARRLPPADAGGAAAETFGSAMLLDADGNVAEEYGNEGLWEQIRRAGRTGAEDRQPGRQPPGKAEARLRQEIEEIFEPPEAPPKKAGGGHQGPAPRR